jgi:small subunit ribosomal protein S20
MPNSVSAKKALRKNLTRRARNKAQRSTLRSAIKKLRETAAGADAAATQEAFKFVVKKLDQAAAKGLIHKNTAARTKSRLSKRMPRPAKSQ